LFWACIATSLEQTIFSVSLVAALSALLLVEQQSVPQDTAKDKLWQELYEARQEITKLYDENKELALRLEVAREEKQNLQEDRESAEADIAKLLAHMHEMATRENEPRFAQLQQQFQEKSNLLDSTRRELFYTQEEVSKLKKTLELETRTPTAYEKA